MALPPRDHRISLEAAAALTKRYREKAPTGARRAGAFHADQVKTLFAQEGCAALRIYYGMNEDDSSALILVGVNADDHDMTDGDILEFDFPCPPFCDGGGL